MRKKQRLNPEAPIRSAAHHRLARFLRLLSHFDRAPWANITFSINETIMHRLIASHIHLICGAEASDKRERAELFSMINPHLVLEGSQHVVWVTNRQQGKTSTMGKFCATLACCSESGGQLINIYSTSLDRAIELMKSSRAYIDYLMSPSGAHPEWANLRYVKNSFNAYSLQNGPNAPINQVVSKPKNVDSCRGDAPKCAMFDEIAFMQENFWYKFAFPLLQVSERVCTCCTTPPAPNSFFETFIENVRARNAKNDMFFKLINHSLSCKQCIEIGQAAQCTHNLHFIPPWKSIQRFTQLRVLVPTRQQKNFEKEVFGVLADAEGGYFPKRLVNAFIGRARHNKRFVAPSPPACYVSIDPAGHQVSEMALCAHILCPSTGMTVIVGLASINVSQCEMLHIQALTKVFLKR